MAATAEDSKEKADAKKSTDPDVASSLQRPTHVRPKQPFSMRTRLDGLAFEINQTWDGHPCGHEPYKFRLDWSFARRPGKPHKRAIKVDLYGPFFDDPEAPNEIPGYKPGLWDYEVFELFFANDRDEYLEVEVGPHGHWLVYLLRGVRQPFNQGEELDIEIIENAYADGGQSWHIKFEIPLGYLPAQVTKFNAYAIHGSDQDRHYDALYPVTDGTHAEPDFHRLDYFKKIDLTKLMPEGINDMPYVDYCIGELWNQK